jgi:hypothetical protein
MDDRFTVNLEGKRGLTYREKACGPVVSIDIIDGKVVSANYLSLLLLIARDWYAACVDAVYVARRGHHQRGGALANRLGGY